MRSFGAAVCVVAVALLPACGKNEPPPTPPHSAQPGTFGVLNADFECSADQERAYYRDIAIADADPSTFPPGKAVTGCDETSIAFAD